MADVFFPDRSQFQGHTVSHELIVCARSSEGNWLTDPDYAWNVAEAKAIGARQFAYHFLEDGSSAASQAAWAHAIAGKAPMMLDLEPIVGLGAVVAGPQGPPAGQGHYCGQSWVDLNRLANADGPGADGGTLADLAVNASFVSRPSIALAEAFVDAYRKAGGIIHDLYLPHWYWQSLGSPDLAGMRSRGMFLTSSDYAAYSDKGPGWGAYGGMSPQVWQYTDRGPWSMDWNAYKGTSGATTAAAATAELWALLTTGTRTGTGTLTQKAVASAAGQSLNELVLAHPGNGPAGALVHSIRKWPSQWDGKAQRDYLNAGDWNAPLPTGTWFLLWV